jgi:hypothetical protein
VSDVLDQEGLEWLARVLDPTVTKQDRFRAAEEVWQRMNLTRHEPPPSAAGCGSACRSTRGWWIHSG